MKVYEILENVEVQSEVRLCYYDDEREERIEVADNESNREKEIRYVYVEGDAIYLELEMDGEN